MTALAMQRYAWDPENGAWDADLDTGNAWLREDRPIPVCNPIFRYLSFGSEPLPTWYSNPRDIYLRNDEHPMAGQRYTPLTDHAVALRSFATFPAAVTMWFDFSDSTSGTPLNLLGITVWDVMRCLHSKYVLYFSFPQHNADFYNHHSLDFELSIHDLVRLLRGPFTDLFKRNRPSPDFLGDLQRFSTPRGLWSATYVLVKSSHHSVSTLIV